MREIGSHVKKRQIVVVGLHESFVILKNASIGDQQQLDIQINWFLLVARLTLSFPFFRQILILICCLVNDFILIHIQL